jgi:hypothetical protein
VHRLAKTRAASLIRASLYIFNAMLWVSMAVNFATGNIYGGIVTGLFALIHIGWTISVQRLIPFTAVLAQWTSLALGHFPGLLAVALTTLAAQIAALSLVIVGVSMVMRSTAEADTGPQLAFTLYGVFVALWLFGVLQNILHVATSGAVGTFYYQGAQQLPGGVVARALGRAVTTSLGSIVFGSLLVSLVQTLRFVLSYLKRHARDNGSYFLLLCLDCFVSLLESALRYFNAYAFVIVSLRGSSYLTSAKEAYELIKSHGISMLINDDLTGITLFVASASASVAVGGVAALGTFIRGPGASAAAANAAGLDMRDPLVVFAATATTVFLLLNTVFAVAVSSTRTLFVCMAEHPAAVAEHHAALEAGVRAARQRQYDEGRADEGGADAGI